MANGFSDILRARGAFVPAGMFICPVCLMRRPLSQATAGHYPARSLPVPHATTLSCSTCDPMIGATYEPLGVDRLQDIKSLVIRPPDRRNGITLRGTIDQSDPKGLTIGLHTKRDPKNKLGKTLTSMRVHSQSPNLIALDVSNPTEDTERQSLLAWSFLAWCQYARYGYAATPGALAVRKLILDPSSPVPATVRLKLSNDSGRLAIDRPVPVLYVRSNHRPVRSVGDVTEMIGIGIDWTGARVILPFASDGDGRCWVRMKELDEADELATVVPIKVQSLLPDGSLRRRLRHGLGFGTTDGLLELSRELSDDELQLIAVGDSPYRLAPTKGKWRRHDHLEYEMTLTTSANSEFWLDF